MARFWRALVGEFHYEPPDWMPCFARAADDHLKANPGAYASLIVLVGCVSAALPSLLEWQRAHQPSERQHTEIRRVSAKLAMPDVTPVVKNKAQPQAITLTFDGSVAKLDAERLTFT